MQDASGLDTASETGLHAPTPVTATEESAYLAMVIRSAAEASDLTLPTTEVKTSVLT